MTKTKAKPAPAKSVSVQFGPDEAEAADLYLDAKERKKVAEEQYAKAKAQLEVALGDCKVGLLPDGRTVIRTVSEFPACTQIRKAYSTSTITIN